MQRMGSGTPAASAASAPAADYPAIGTVPAWETLKAAAAATPTGADIEAQWEQRASGSGSAHTDAKLRLFGSSGEPRVTLYRDQAGWCPYCQKVWLLLEEKQIPYRIEKVPMRSYGDKPQWFMKLVPGGMLPVIKLDGEIITESLVIMQVLDNEFQGPAMLPPSDTEDFNRANKLLRLERELFSCWCQLTFRPSMPLGGGAKAQFEQCLDEVNAALAATPGPWFLGGDYPSLVDLQYISHVERMAASLAYWKGMQLRNTERWAALEAWFQAFEARQCYQATKSDYYTHVMDIPPQYGPAFSDKSAESFASSIDGSDGRSWNLPLAPLESDELQPNWAPPGVSDDDAEMAARHEAAWKIISNHGPLTRFTARGAGKPGRKRFQAPLADPYAEPDEASGPAIDLVLRHIAQALLSGSAADPSAIEGMTASLKQDLATMTTSRADTECLKACLRYLQERVGVPRDMTYPAARQFRAHLGWAMSVVA